VAAAQQVSTQPNSTTIAQAPTTVQGVSRFWQLDLQDKQRWSYSKQENITDFSPFHYCISESASLPGFSIIATANGFHPMMLYSNKVIVRLC
jgi:hypothetical protein